MADDLENKVNCPPEQDYNCLFITCKECWKAYLESEV
jgi:hypothetical protein